MRTLLVLSALVLVAGTAAVMEAQPARDIAMQISMPGARPILRVRNGEIGTIALGDAGTFGIRPTVVDATSGFVNVSVLEGGRRDGLLLAEFDATLGGPAVESGTTPPFTVEITAIFER